MRTPDYWRVWWMRWACLVNAKAQMWARCDRLVARGLDPLVADELRSVASTRLIARLEVLPSKRLAALDLPIRVREES